ncbi:hypothetical protein ASC87_16750 [Rhizobacter sp. Root1221]|nr:hypothetical protein ASC87_16750 [Rhizobacter sp. Root1221]
MIVMRNAKRSIRAEAKEASHERIVSAAARANRRRGLAQAVDEPALSARLRESTPKHLTAHSG